MPILDLTGKTFTTFEVLGDNGRRNSSGGVRWRCICLDCDNISYRSARELRVVKFCQCKRSQQAKKNFTTHGMSKSAAYRSWLTMRRRCYEEDYRDYPYYGGRGIKICVLWQMAFENFYQDMGDPPAGMTLDRINVNGHYCKANCSWATHKQQMNNTRRNHFENFNGKSKTLAQWSEEPNVVALGISYGLIRARVRLGWSISDALTTRPGGRWRKEGHPISSKKTSGIKRKKIIVYVRKRRAA